MKGITSKIRILYDSMERANYCIRKYVSLISQTHNGYMTKISKCIIRNILHKDYNIIIGADCKLEECPFFPHPQNIVIGLGVKIGSKCIIYQDVTIGQNKGLYPKIGNGVVIYPGAKIIGGIFVGDGAVIGANSVVTTNVPENSIVGGIPAKIIRQKGSEDVFY